MHKYFYNGPVMEFDKCISEHWSGETMAVSASKAKNNFDRINEKVITRIITLTKSL